MSGKFYPRTEAVPTREWLTLPEIRETRRVAPRSAWSTRILWFAIGFIVARLVVGA